MTEELKEPATDISKKRRPPRIAKNENQAMYSELVLRTEESQELDRKRQALIRRGMAAMNLADEKE
jgi:hypothetical protein